MRYSVNEGCTALVTSSVMHIREGKQNDAPESTVTATEAQKGEMTMKRHPGPGWYGSVGWSIIP